MEAHKNPLVESWTKRRLELLSQPADKRDKLAYYKNLIWTFRHDLGRRALSFILLLLVELYCM